MTLAPNQIGDHHQRYEVRYCSDEDAEDTQVLAWSKTKDAADKMAASWRLRPGIKHVWVIDRDMAKRPSINECDREGSMNIEVKRLSSGHFHIRGVGLCNWSQPANWPCDEAELRQSAHPECSDTFIRAALAHAATFTALHNAVAT